MRPAALWCAQVIDQPPADRRINIVGGCGHVGLPLGLAFAQAGFDVTLYDINAAAVALVNDGCMPFMDRGADEVLRASIGRTLRATTRRESVGEADVVVVVTGTPVDAHLNPDLGGLRALIDELHPHLRAPQLLVMRSTVYPGVTEYVGRALHERGLSLDVAFCPERVAEGVGLEEICSLPQIVSGLSPQAVSRARALFSALTQKTIELPAREAELAKLFTNAARYIHFAVANQFYTMATREGLDFYRIYGAMTEDYPRMRGFPRPGFAAGPCLFKDTMQLSAFGQNAFFLGHSAMLINEGLPNFVVEQLKAAHPLRSMTVGIAGMAFKAGSDDKRDSLSYKLRKVLRMECARVLCSDPYVKDDDFVPLETLARESEVIILGVPHPQYRDYDFGQAKVVDVWNLLGQGGQIA